MSRNFIAKLLINITVKSRNQLENYFISNVMCLGSENNISPNITFTVKLQDCVQNGSL